MRSVLVVLLTCLIGIVEAQNNKVPLPICIEASRTTPKSDQAIANALACQLWSTLLTKCGDDYYYAGSQLDTSFPGSGPTNGASTLIGYGDIAPLNVVEIPLDSAAKHNGIQWQGETAMLPKSWRVRDIYSNQWSDWSAPDPSPTNSATFAVLRNGLNGSGMPGPLRLQIRKVAGQWFYYSEGEPISTALKILLAPAGIDSSSADAPSGELKGRAVSCYAIQSGTDNPPEQTLESDNKYVITNSLQFVPLSPQAALTLQMGAVLDFTSSLDEPKFTRFKPDSTLVRVLSDDITAIPKADRESHTIKEPLSSKANVWYVKANSLVLVKADNGQFGLLPDSYFLPKSGFLAPKNSTITLITIPMKDRLYRGSVQGFIAALPNFFAAAARSANLDPDDYKDEIEVLDKIAVACAEITPAKIKAATTQYGNVDTRKLAPYEQTCVRGKGDITYMAKKIEYSPNEIRRRVFVEISPTVANEERDGWAQARGFVMGIRFGGKSSDGGGTTLETGMSHYGIVVATITP